MHGFITRLMPCLFLNIYLNWPYLWFGHFITGIILQSYISAIPTFGSKMKEKKRFGLRVLFRIFGKLPKASNSDLGAKLTTNNTLYVSKGKSAVLKCQVYSKSFFFWRGPGRDIYTNGFEINPAFSNKLKIVGNITIGEYNLQINNVTEKEEGIYKCFHEKIKNSTFHRSITSVTLIIQDPPTIRIIKNVTKKILKCEPDGIPRNYRFHRWQHLSEYGQLIRLLPNNQTLQMEQNSANTCIDKFKLSGIYVCSAENGVADIHGSTVQTGEVSVLLQDKPRIVAATQNKQYGFVGTKIDISIMVYCYPEFSIVNILTTDFCCFNETEYQLVVDYNVTVSSFKQRVLMKGYKISLEGFTLTEKDFTTYSFWIQNEIGEETFSVKLMAKENKFKSKSGYGPGWLLMGCSVGGIVICSICFNIYCYIKGTKRVNVMLQTYPEEHYDEIGTMNYNNVVFEPTTDVTQENNDISRGAGDIDTDILLRVESNSSKESSSERLTGFSQSSDGYENPYQSINPENIEIHPYSSLDSNIYQNTIIFPVSAKTKHTNISEETNKTHWLIIYTKKQEAE